MCWLTSPLGIERSRAACRNCRQADVPEFASYVEDEFNARTIEVGPHRSFADVLADVKQAHAAPVEAL